MVLPMLIFPRFVIHNHSYDYFILGICIKKSHIFPFVNRHNWLWLGHGWDIVLLKWTPKNKVSMYGDLRLFSYKHNHNNNYWGLTFVGYKIIILFTYLILVNTIRRFLLVCWQCVLVYPFRVFSNLCYSVCVFFVRKYILS